MRTLADKRCVDDVFSSIFGADVEAYSYKVKGVINMDYHACGNLFAEFVSWSVVFYKSGRVATAQGKQGIWMFNFSDRKNTGNLPNDIREIFLHREKFEVLKISCTKFVMVCCCNLWLLLNILSRGHPRRGMRLLHQDPLYLWS